MPPIELPTREELDSMTARLECNGWAVSPHMRALSKQGTAALSAFLPEALNTFYREAGLPAVTPMEPILNRAVCSFGLNRCFLSLGTDERPKMYGGPGGRVHEPERSAFTLQIAEQLNTKAGAHHVTLEAEEERGCIRFRGKPDNIAALINETLLLPKGIAPIAPDAARLGASSACENSRAR